MGNCFSNDANIENSIITQMELMKIRSLPMTEVKSILYANITSINGFELNKLSEESLKVYKRTLKTISFDNFNKLGTEHFYHDHSQFQSSYFKLLHQASKSRRSIAFLYLIPISKDTDDQKMKYFIDSFFALNEQTKQSYNEIKAIMTNYIKNTLTIPFLSIKNTFEDDNIKESIDNLIDQTYNEKNINLFVEYIFVAFERKLNAENDDENSNILSWSDDYFKEIIETYKNFLFDYQLLKAAFIKKIR